MEEVWAWTEARPDVGPPLVRRTLDFASISGLVVWDSWRKFVGARIYFLFVKVRAVLGSRVWYLCVTKQKKVGVEVDFGKIEM